MKDEFLPTPDIAKWNEIRSDFLSLWQFPNCIGAVDGKHVQIKAPANSGSQFFNYKGHFSIVLMATVDAKYRFVVVDIGGYGRQCDSTTFTGSAFGSMFEAGKVDLPPPTVLPGTDIECPSVFVADEAFALKTYMLRPFPGKELNESRRIFNYRLSRARRVVENAFGILSARWRIYKRCIDASPSHVDEMIKATIVLHNFCIAKNPTYGADQDVDASSSAFENVSRLGSNFRSATAASIRDKFTEYFTSEAGKVPWQAKLIESNRI